jgi:CheY-like chemotaxis protein
MPVKILLADKSITIQKVVEMLFSGKEYEVTCVSDGETALHEATRLAPDLLLVDVDLPRMDGYRFAIQCKTVQALAATPVILMLSRDDAYDAGRGAQAGIADHIAKPFESQDLIGKVKRALTAASAAKPAAQAKRTDDRLAAPQPQRPPATPVEAPPLQNKAAPSDIADIMREAAVSTTPKPPAPPRPVVSQPAPGIQAKPPVPSEKREQAPEAPASFAVSSPASVPPPAGAALPEEEVFEVEPEIEVEPEPEKAAPAASVRETVQPAPIEPRREPSQRVSTTGEWTPPADEQPFPAVTEANAGNPASIFESEMELEMLSEQTAAPRPSAAEARPSAQGPLADDAERALPLGAKALEEIREGLGLAEEPSRDDLFKPSGMQSEIVSFESLDMASRVSHEDYAPPAPARQMPPQAPPALAAAPPTAPPAESPAAAEVSEELMQAVTRQVVEKMAKEIIERVAWEIIPDLAERLIRDEIERLRSEQ